MLEVTEAPKRPRRASFKRKVGSGLKRKPRAVQKRSAVSKKKPKSVSKLMKELDGYFSRWVRLSAADGEGFVSCYTCGYRAHYKKMQNGHYISRFYKKYRFDPRNCRVQCSMCNIWKSGDLATFRMKLVREIGREEVESMESDYKELFKLDPVVLQEKILEYQKILESL